MIAARNVSKVYGGFTAVDNLSFNVAAGEILVLLGTSGSGKTTTLKMLNRIISPTAGRISINGTDVRDLPVEKLRRGIGYVLQHNSLFPHYTVAQNIAIVPQLIGWGKTKIDRRVGELLEAMRLPQAYGNKYPAQLSGGEQQRVNIARALAADPPILLMDEPFGALDAITRETIRSEFKALEQLRHKAVIIVTHDVDEAFYLGQYVGMMHEGKMVQHGTSKELLFSPTDIFVRSFLEKSWVQLALKTTTVADIWPFLPMGSPTATEPSDDVDTALWTLFNSGNPERVWRQHGEIKGADWNSIMAAFEQFRMEPARR